MDFGVIKSNLEKNGFTVSCFETANEATEYLAKELKDKTIGIGGSVTVQDMGLYEKLCENNTIYWHWKDADKEIYKSAQTADIYISSVNGIAETGEIINIDGTCNRVSAIMYGHAKVYLIVGKNKIAPDYEKALFRARNIAAPLNAKRLSRKTPCAKLGDKCYNCNSPERICNATVIIERPCGGTETVILFVDEELGY